MKNAHDVLREEKKKQQVRIVSKEEVEKLENDSAHYRGAF